MHFSHSLVDIFITCRKIAGPRSLTPILIFFLLSLAFFSLFLLVIAGIERMVYLGLSSFLRHRDRYDGDNIFRLKARFSIWNEQGRNMTNDTPQSYGYDSIFLVLFQNSTHLLHFHLI